MTRDDINKFYSGMKIDPAAHDVKPFETSQDLGKSFSYQKNGELSSKWIDAMDSNGNRTIVGRGYNQTYAPMPMEQPAATAPVAEAPSMPEFDPVKLIFGEEQAKYGNRTMLMDEIKKSPRMLHVAERAYQHQLQFMGQTRPTPQGPITTRPGDRVFGANGMLLAENPMGSEAPKPTWAPDASAVIMGDRLSPNPYAKTKDSQPYEPSQGPTVYDEESDRIGTYDPKTGAYQWSDRQKYLVEFGREGFKDPPATMPRYQNPFKQGAGGAQGAQSVTPQEVKRVRVQGKDGKTYTLPEDQVEAAKAQGYSVL